MATNRYFRWQPTAMRVGGTGVVQASEFWFLNGGSPVTPTLISGVGDNFSGGEGSDTLGDNNTATKWCNTNGLTGYALFDFGTTVIIDGYRWATGNDAPERDPISWTIEGSDNNTTWTLIDTVTNFTGTTTRQVYNPDFSFPIVNPPYNPPTDIPADIPVDPSSECQIIATKARYGG
jgi:hypothetical protein